MKDSRDATYRTGSLDDMARHEGVGPAGGCIGLILQWQHVRKKVRRGAEPETAVGVAHERGGPGTNQGRGIGRVRRHYDFTEYPIT